MSCRLLAKHGSMGKAATQLSASQPAISKTIADMEYALGVRLLERTSRGVEPTIYGRALLDRGLVTFDKLKQAVKHIEFLPNPNTGELWVGSTIAIATGFLPTVVDQLSRRYPRIVFHVSAGESAMTYRALDERKVDLVVAPIFAPMTEEHMRAWHSLRWTSRCRGRDSELCVLGLLLAGCRQTDRVSQLVTALKDPNAAVRQRAAKALGEIKDPRAVEPLM